MMLIAILLGLFLQYFEIPSSPLILAVVLGGNIETYLRRGCNMAENGWHAFFTRPVSLVLLVVAVMSIFGSLFGDKIKAARQKNN